MDKLTDGFTDEEIWMTELTPASSTAVIAQKMRLIAEAATWLEPRVRRARRRIERLNREIEAYLAQEHTT